MKDYWQYLTNVFVKTWPGAVFFIFLAAWNCVEHRQSPVVVFFSFLGKWFDVAVGALVGGLLFWWLAVTLVYAVIYLTSDESPFKRIKP